MLGARQQNGGHAIKLHLHIGTEKTGTSSFQRWLKANKEALEARGICRPAWPKRFLYDSSHRMLSVYAQGFAPEEDAQQLLGLTTAAEHASLCADFETVFEREIARGRADGKLEGGPGCWIISGEHMHSRLSTTAQVQRLAGLLRRHFSAITVHVHLRPQADLANSIISTIIRQGGHVSPDFFKGVQPDNPYYNYAALVARWESAFGAANLRVIPYKQQPSIRAYFLDLWQLAAADFSPELKVNRALGWRTVALQNAIYPYRHKPPAPYALGKVFEALPQEAPLNIGWATAQQISKRMRPINEALILARPDLRLEDLTPDRKSYEGPETFSKVNTPCDFSEQAAGVISELQFQLTIEKAEVASLRADKLISAGRLNAARVKLARANVLLQRIEPVWGQEPRYIRLQRDVAKMLLDLLT